MSKNIPIDDPQTDVVFNYKTLRCQIGIIAFAIPWVCIAAIWIAQKQWLFPTSISVTYHLGAGDVFVGMLVIVGAFLLAYNGHQFPHFQIGGRRFKYERVMALVAGVCAFGVAFFPTDVDRQWINSLISEGYQLADYPTLSLDYLVANKLAQCKSGCGSETCILSLYSFAPTVHMFSAVTLFLVLVHVPAQFDHPFRFNPITDFGLTRSFISDLSDQN